WKLNGNDLYASSTTWNVGIGTINTGAKLNISGGEGVYVAPNFGSTNLGAINILNTVSDRRNAITFSSAGSVNAQAGIYVHQDNSTGTHMYLATTNSYATGPQARLTILNNGNVGIGRTPSYKLDVNGTANFTGTVSVPTPTAGGHAATKAYVDDVVLTGTSTSAYVRKTGDTMTGNLDMGGNNISGINKISVGTIDPLYDIRGIKYSTFASAIAGGVKEEYIGQGQIKKCNSQSCYWYLDFDQIEEGSDSWVWRQTVDFRPEKVEVLMTAQGLPTPLSYEFKDNGIIFHAERPTKFSYRLIGARFDWRKWPTKALDQNEKASLTIK
ncbi:MAG TPA: hypothetical protein PLT32_03450, partial [bacterium]|nr:hypothetical protein [bacterium]